MYKAINIRNGSAVTILDARWASAVDELRSLDREDVLVCQGCRQPLRVRAGEIRRRHFAHKHRENCNYGHDSPELLDAWAMLYEWLVTKTGEIVKIEEKVEDSRFPRPVDCWVEREGGTVAYWIIDATMKPEIREAIQAGFNERGILVSWVFISKMLRDDKKEDNGIHLTTTERDFMRKTAYDDLAERYYHVGKSLHYLDTDNGNLITL